MATRAASDEQAPGAALVGTPMARREDARILRGEARYLDDVVLPGMAHAAFVRSPHARAGIAAIRAPEPGAAEGLLGVWTAADLGERVRPFPVQAPAGAEVAGDAGHPVLAGAEARYAGQPVALVVAESRALAEDAAELVDVDYEPLDAAVAVRDAPEALVRWRRSAGDVDGAFAAAAHVARGSYRLPRLVAVPIECRGAVCAYDRGVDLLTVWCSAQDPHRPLAQLAHVLDRPDDRIRVVVPDVGGAFGSKGVIAAEAVAAAVAAMDLGRPVKWAEDRLENFLAAYQGRGMEADVELALDADGRMLAVRAVLHADLGAYLFTTSAIPAHTTAMLMCGCYDIPAAEVTIAGARTDKVPTGPYRGAGRPEAAHLLEQTVDRAARDLGLDPVELRRRNLVRAFPHRTPLGFVYDSGDYERCLDLALELVEPERGDDGSHVIGWGVALYVERGGGMWESADVTVEPSGRVVVRSGASPHGQGHDTTFAQIAADRLGVDPGAIVLRFGDTAVVPRGVGTFASRSVAMGGSALAVACDRIVAKARRIAAHALDTEPDALAHEQGAMIAPDGRALTFAEIAAAAYDPARLPPGLDLGLEAAGRFHSEQVFASGAYAAVVSIERETGRLAVRRIAAVDDAGTIVNPLLAHGQVVGGTVQGLGECVSEAAVHDESGQLRTGSLLDYSLLTAAEIPPIRVGVVQTPSPLNPLGAKGIGEGGAIGTLPAVAAAVVDALGGRHVDPPYDEQTLWEALRR
ncbi:MAG TPA: xanthine dehydrogenase family protein molybdopterin-binding subunit [Capillimicrobium sp.]|nr:xanthine dehydrogenase family protein molybdopterin-binding subunit [Capillimicrobium sp.]